VDNCPDTPNADQLDSDGNGTGDACEGQDCQASLAQCTTSLSAMSGELSAATADADNDGHRDQDDACADTPAGAAVDAAGCSQAQFDCTFTKSARACQPKL
jgi:hypothetical protein